ncbi:MAG: alpha/beta hydrolase [Gemmatimonadetes bacterium]|nr:alpha/beta hydrolase [Gemmatimonadota bacterium]
MSLIRLPLIVTWGLVVLWFLLDVTNLAAGGPFNINWIIPAAAAWLSVICLRAGRGYGGFLFAALLYTAGVRLLIILLAVLGKMAGLEGEYFTWGRNVLFGLVIPHVFLWPVVTFIAGTLIWPVLALAMRRRQVSYRGAAMGVVVILLIVFIALPYLISTLYTGSVGSPRTARNTPADHGLDYEEVTLTTSDGLNLAAWYIPNDAGRGTVIYCHGHTNHRGQMLDQAAFLHENGFRGMLFDFRRHGDSEGDLTTFGYYEWRDVQAAVRYAVDERGEGGPVILWGISMGAATALLAAAEISGVDAVIAESSFYAASETLRSDLNRMFGLPTVPFGFLTGTITELRVGIKIDDLDIGRAVSGLEDTSVLLVGGSADRRMPLANNERLYAQIPGAHKEIYVAEGATHGDIWEMDREAYAEKVLAFLEKSGLTDESDGLDSPAEGGETDGPESPPEGGDSDESR